MKAYPRAELVKQKLLLPVDIGWLRATNTGYDYRWIHDTYGFQILYKGLWADAYSIDFEFR